MYVEIDKVYILIYMYICTCCVVLLCLSVVLLCCLASLSIS